MNDSHDHMTDPVSPMENRLRTAAEESGHEGDKGEHGEAPTAVGGRSVPNPHLARVLALKGQILDDIDRTADAIGRHEFAEDGSGDLGTLFRTIKSMPQDDRVEAWSHIIEIASALWDSERSEACLAFAQAAHLHLDTPEIFRARIEAGIVSAKNILLAEKAEKRFEEGDAEGACAFAAQVTGPQKQDYINELHLRQKRRRRTKVASLVMAGVLIATLGAISFNGALGMRDLLRNPPVFALPDLPESNLVSDLKAARIMREVPDPDRIEKLFRGEADATEDEGDETAPVAPPAAPHGEEVTGVGNEAPAIDQIRDEPAPPQGLEPPTDIEAAQAQAVYNCALGQSVSRRAIESAGTSPAADTISQLRDFVAKVNQACTSLDVPQSEIDGVAQQIPSHLVEKMADNLLGG